MGKDLFIKYLQGTCTEKEFDEIQAWLIGESKSFQSTEMVKQIWNEFEPDAGIEEKAKYNRILDKIHNKINLNSPKSKQTVIKKISSILIRAAAVLFIPFLISTLWLAGKQYAYEQDHTMITLQTPLGSKLKTTLPDGTEVWQNSGTTLKYPTQFKKGERLVELDGEAYFHVSSDKKNPFYVKTSVGSVEVTGTRFNVSAYAEDELYSVVLEDGEINYQPVNTDKRFYLEPSQKLVYNRSSSSFKKQQVDVEKYIAWTTGKLIFRNDDLENVVTQLERWFNAEIVLDDPSGKLKSHSFTLTIQNETLPQVLNYITQAASLKVNISQSNKNTNGAIAKVKYIISK